MTIFTRIMAVGVIGISSYLVFRSYREKHSSVLPKGNQLLLARNHENYAKEKLTKICTVENWGEIYRRLKKNKTTGEKYFINVLYMHPSRSSLYEIFFNTQRNRWERCNGQALSDGLYTIVLTKDWKMLACNTSDEDFFNNMIKEKLISKVFFKHTTLTRGEGVHFAGMGKLEEGRFIWDGQSGHYRPQAFHVSLCKAWLESQKVTGSIYIQSKKEKIRQSTKA